MVDIAICAGNPGTVTFLANAYSTDMFRAERCFQRMQDNNITGAKLYMLWNDCCGRDTERAMTAMEKMPIDTIVRHINYENGRGTVITDDELLVLV